MKLIRLYGKHSTGARAFAKVDDEWFEYLSQWHWRAKPSAGGFFYPSRTAYRQGGKTVTVRMHSVVSHALGGVDHVDHDTFNCQSHNLRHAGQASNLRNAERRIARGVCIVCAQAFERNVSALGGRSRPIRRCGKARCKRYGGRVDHLRAAGGGPS